MKKNKQQGDGGIGFISVIAIVFIVLKLIGVIEWSWMWVLSPLWIGLILALIIPVIILVAIFINSLRK